MAVVVAAILRARAAVIAVAAVALRVARSSLGAALLARLGLGDRDRTQQRRRNGCNLDDVPHCSISSLIHVSSVYAGQRLPDGTGSGAQPRGSGHSDQQAQNRM